MSDTKDAQHKTITRDDIADVIIYSILFPLQLFAWYIMLHYATNGGKFRDKSRNVSQVSPEDPMFVFGALLLTPFVLITFYRVVRLLLHFLEVAWLTYRK